MSIQTKITAAEYFQLPETNLPIELIEGEIIRMPSPIPEHQDVLLNTAILVRQKAKTVGGRVFVAPLDVHLDDGNVVQPDLLWVAENSHCIVTDKHLVGAPDLIVEILSPGSIRHDRKIKFRLYEKHGVREYWMVDLTEKLLEVWQLIDDKFHLIDIYAEEETISASLLGEIVIKEIFS